MLIITGYNSTPRYEDGGQRTPRYGGGSGSSSGGRSGSAAGRTPQDRRTPRGHYGDATPLYDE